MKVALYARVSTQRQEKKGTIASQVEALRTHARQQKYEVAEDYVCCDDGYSGTLGQNWIGFETGPRQAPSMPSWFCLPIAYRASTHT